MHNVVDFVKNREPVATSNVLTAGIAVLAAFGLDFTAEQTAALVAFVQIVSGYLTRRNVTPTGSG